MPTIEELQQQVELLSNELSNQAEQFAEWRRGISDVAIVASESAIPSWERVIQIQAIAKQVCGL